VKTELRALNLINQKKKGIDQGALIESVNQKKPTRAPPKCRPTGPAEPCEKCGRTNHTTFECRVRTNKCMWCGSPKHLIATCPGRLKAVDEGTIKSLAPNSLKAPTCKAYGGRNGVFDEQKGSCHFTTAVTETFSLNSKSFCILLDSGATHSFISTRSAKQLNLKNIMAETN